MTNYIIYKSIAKRLSKKLNISTYVLNAVCIYTTVEKYGGRFFKLHWAAEMDLLNESSLRRFREELRATGLLDITWINEQQYYYFSVKGKELQHKIELEMRYKKDELGKVKLRGVIPKTILAKYSM